MIVTHGDRGYEFADAFSIAINGKDKMVILGRQAGLQGPLNKLPARRIEGTILKDAAAGIPGLDSEEGIEYILPDGLPKSAPADAVEIWKTARIAYKKAQNDKAPTEISISSFAGFLPGGSEELARLCRDRRQLEILGGKEKIFATQMELMAAVVRAFPNDPEVAKLEKYVERSMRQRYDDFENGAAGTEALDEAMKIAELSQAVYPDKPEQQKLRAALAARKEWLARKMAILRAFAAAREWDAFILGDRDFERYQHSFPEMAKLQADALRASLALHRQNGEDRLRENEYGAAWREFRLASFRQPSDKVLQQNVMMAWTDYSRQAAIDVQGQQKKLTAGQREAIKQALLFATNYKAANKLDEALRSVTEAEAIDPDSLPVLLKKAEILGAQHEFIRAFAALDAYDLRAVNEERDPASKLRAELLYQRTSMLDDVKARYRKAWAESSFHKAYAAAQLGLRAKEDDADLLYGAGLTAVILRKAAEGRASFNRYLEAANTLDANAEQRARVRVLLSSITESKPAESGSPDWLSGKKLPAGVYYSPSSLAFQPRIDRIEASGKMRVTFEWDGDRLKSIVPAFEKADRSTGERKISFAYNPSFPQVASVDYEAAAKPPTTTDPDEFVKRSSVVLENNPSLDPVAIQRFTGKNITIGIAGNRFFLPFVWDKIHYFQLTYDDQGRVSQAREIASPGASPGDFRLEFEWDGQLLDAVTGFQGKSKIYERSLQYQEGRLVSEEIQAQGKTSRIKYVYNAGRLASATCDKDSTLDDRSRQVVFR